jgi:hypothetical protein
MTSDRARKKAARAQQAATGQPYMQARRSVQRQTSSRAEPVEPPPIDPRDHAVYSHQWGERSCYLLLHQGRYYTWITDPSINGRPEVRRVPSEHAGRPLVDEWQARNVLHTGWGEAIEHIFLTDSGLDKQICYDATVVDVEGSGLWLAGQGALVAGETGYVVGQFTELGFALTAFADQAEAAAEQAGRNGALNEPDVLAGVLRYRAAKTRADVARARLGDALRVRWGQGGGQAELDRGLSPAMDAAGLNPGTFRQVLAGREFTWPSGPVVRPPGSRRADTPVTVLTQYTVEGQQFTLLCYQDSAGANCVAIAHDGHSAVVKDLPVDERNLVSQGSLLTSTRGGLGATYGRAHDSVTALYSLGTDGQRTDWPIHDDPRTGERYFAVVANTATLADIVAEAPTESTSLKVFFDMWFNPPPRPQPR